MIQLPNNDLAQRWSFLLQGGFVISTIGVSVAAILMGCGLWMYRGGMPRVWKEIRARGALAAALVALYGVLGILALVAVVFLGRATLVLWIVASIILAAGASIVSSFLRSLETKYWVTVSGSGFTWYAGLNAIGVCLFAASLWTPSPPYVEFHLSPQSVLPVPAWAMVELLLVPIAGVVAFRHLIRQGWDVRDLWRDSRSIAEPYPPTPYSRTASEVVLRRLHLHGDD